MARYVVVGGAPIGDYDSVRRYLRPDDFVVYCDCGLRHMDGLGVPASLIIGDFDSHEQPETTVETIVLPHKKDDTDTVFAVREGLRRGYTDYLLLGAAGARFDHTMANVSILLWLDTLGRTALLVDDYSEMEIISREEKTVDDRFPYFSLVNLAGPVSGLTIRDALYELTDADLSCDYQYAVSNEPIPGKTARISVKNGRVLLIRDR